MVSLLPPEVEDDLRQRFGERFTVLTPAEVQAVVTAQIEGSVTNGRMQELTGQHRTDVTDLLRGLVRQGLLQQQKQRRWSSYRVTGADADGKDFHLSGANSPHSKASSLRSSDGNSPHSEASSHHSEGDSHPSTAVGSPLWNLAAPARTRRLAREALAALILQLCADEWLSARQLAELLGRDQSNLQTRMLTALVKSGQLRLLHPEVPNRPDQAYRTKERAT